MSRCISHHCSVLSQSFAGLGKDSFNEYAHVDRRITCRGDNGTAAYGGPPEVRSIGAGGGEGFGGGEVGEIVGVVSNVEESCFGGEVGILIFNLRIDLGFEVEVLDYCAFGLLGKFSVSFQMGMIPCHLKVRAIRLKMGDQDSEGAVLKSTYTFDVARECTPDKSFQPRKFIRDLDDGESLSSLCFPSLNGSLARKVMFPEVSDKEYSFDALSRASVLIHISVCL